MHTDPYDHGWWTFSVDEDERADPTRSRFQGDGDINPPLAGGRHMLDYHRYLGLDSLLASQRPSSSIPDERVFIITHQLHELTFKMVAFDFAVIARTLEKLLAAGDAATILRQCAEDEPFWRPALTAAARASFACRELLPSYMRYLGDPRDADETFSSIEFYRFRKNLEPASGFQSAQFRLIQRGLGKANLLSIRLFPSDTYREQYGDTHDATATVVDPLILRNDAGVATPAGDSPYAIVAKLDDIAHRVLARIGSLGGAQSGSVDNIAPADVDRATDILERILSSRRKEVNAADKAEREMQHTAAITRFRADMGQAVATENQRRDGLQAARAGAQMLRKRAHRSYLADVLRHIARADEALHDPSHDSFLSVHLRVTRERLRQVNAHAAKVNQEEPTIGTGGGGIEYLGWAQKHLIPLFPALVAYREVGE
jgi:tryptophan 2,3-dioxygenase